MEIELSSSLLLARERKNRGGRCKAHEDGEVESFPTVAAATMEVAGGCWRWWPEVAAATTTKRAADGEGAAGGRRMGVRLQQEFSMHVPAGWKEGARTCWPEGGRDAASAGKLKHVR
jgi:hypothetical protein